NVSVISENMGKLSSAGDENGQSFEQMNIAFREIATGAGDQVESTLQITEAAEETNHLIDQMLDSLKQLRNRSETANEHSVLGSDKVDQLYRTIADFKNNIEQMAVDIHQLNKTI